MGYLPESLFDPVTMEFINASSIADVIRRFLGSNLVLLDFLSSILIMNHLKHASFFLADHLNRFFLTLYISFPMILPFTDLFIATGFFGRI